MRLQSLDLNLLVLFAALLTDENVSRVASRLQLSQPTISNALTRLRHHFEDDLFVPSGRRMVATPFAEGLREPIGKVLALATTIAQARPKFEPRRSERAFSVATSDYAATIFLTGAAAGICSEFPNLRIHQVSFSDHAVSTFKKGDIDFLIAPADYLPDLNLRVPLFQDSYVVIASADYTQSKSMLSFEELSRSQLASVRLGSGVGMGNCPSERLFSARSLADSNHIFFPGFNQLAEFVARTQFVALIPKRLALIKMKQLPIRILDAKFELPDFHECLFWMQQMQHDPAAIWLRTQLIEAAKTLI
ncbi:MAG: LysR family transcriptional regulator [Methylovirgula sp.]